MARLHGGHLEAHGLAARRQDMTRRISSCEPGEARDRPAPHQAGGHLPSGKTPVEGKAYPQICPCLQPFLRVETEDSMEMQTGMFLAKLVSKIIVVSGPRALLRNCQRQGCFGSSDAGSNKPNPAKHEVRWFALEVTEAPWMAPLMQHTKAKRSFGALEAGNLDPLHLGSKFVTNEH